VLLDHAAVAPTTNRLPPPPPGPVDPGRVQTFGQKRPSLARSGGLRIGAKSTAEQNVENRPGRTRTGHSPSRSRFATVSLAAASPRTAGPTTCSG